MMRRLTWRNLLRTALLATGVSIGLGAIVGQPLLRSTVIAAEEVAAATVEEAARVLDLNTLPLPEAAKVPFGRHLGGLTYETDGDFKSAFQFHQKQLTKLGWKELPGVASQGEYLSANFQKSGFTVSVTTYPNGDPSKPKLSMVTLTNLGNVRLSKLPVVKGAKQTFATDANASYTTTLKTADAVAATSKLLTEAGWEPYGSNGNPPDSEVLIFKRNAVRLVAFVGVSPAQKGLVMISYSSTLMSADLPALPNAKEIGFDEAQKVLQFQTTDSFENVAKAYKQRLAKSGWTAETAELQKSKFAGDQVFGEMRFKNGAKDSLLLQLTENDDGGTKVRMSLRTAADIAAMQKELQAATAKLAAKEKAQKEADEADEVEVAQTKPASKPSKKAADSDDDDFPDVNALIKEAVGDALKDSGLSGKKPAKGAAKDKDAVSIPIPEGAKKVTQTGGNVLQIKWPAGKGKASAEALRDQLLATGWEANDDDKLEKTSGNMSFLKDGKQLNLTYVDAGVGEVTMMLIGIGVKVSEAKADPGAKVPVASSKPKSKQMADDDDAPSTESLKALKKKIGRKPAKTNDDGDSPVALPARPEKPKRDIAKLDKLPTEAKLAANGEDISLKNIVAYEIVDNGRWVTRILATETPIKQSALIDVLKKNGGDDELRSSSPRLFVELDDQDNPNSMSYAGNGSLGSTGSSGMTGEAIVEEGRARGTFKAKKESEFFGKKIIGEISFDVPVLTRDSQPEKRLTDAKKLETAGNLVVNNKTMKLANFVAYQVKGTYGNETVILFSDKPINTAKLKEALAKDGTDSGYFDFSSQVKVTIDKNDKFSFLNLYADGASINQNTGLVGDAIVEDGRARGTVKLGEEIDFAGKKINFDLTFDLDVIPLATKLE